MSLEITRSIILSVGAFLGFCGVAAGAIGAHLLKSSLTPQDMEVYQTAVRYQMWHVFVLLFLAFLPDTGNAWIGWIALVFIVGILLFSGSLYLLVLTQNKWLGAVTPIGGVWLLVGWGLMLLMPWVVKK